MAFGMMNLEQQIKQELAQINGIPDIVVPRPPQMCEGCSHIDTYLALNEAMKDWFYARTNNHIKLLKEYAQLILTSDIIKDTHPFITRVVIHDRSKYEFPEYEPYVYITWKYRCIREGVSFKVPEHIEAQMIEATEHHVKNNPHHPEYWTNQKGSFINTTDRDKPLVLVDATKMDNNAIIEMVCDWMAVSEEKKSQIRDWAKMNIGIRWDFTENQIDLIYKCIDFFEEQLN